MSDSNQVAFISLLFIPFVLFSCATSESSRSTYDPTTGQSTFESSRAIMGYRSMSGGLASNQRVMWQALASCSGQECTPAEVALVFYNDTSQDLNLDSSRLQLIVDGTAHDWKDLSRITEAPYYRVPPGEFVRVSLPQSAFVEFAKAQKVEVLFGETATSSFNVSFERRAQFREFAVMAGLAK